MSQGSYQGGAFLGEAKHSGTLSFAGGCMVFRYDGGEVMLPLQGMRIRRGGAAQRLVFFSHASHLDCELFTGEAGILRDPALQRVSGAAAQVRRLRGGTRARVAVFAGIAFFLLGVAWGLWAMRGVAFDWAIDRIPVSVEEKLGEGALRQVVATRAPLADSAVVAGVAVMTDPLVAAADSPYTFRFRVVQDESVNAFALPGGNIVLHSGLLLAADSAEEVAGVVAHEMGHVIHRHGLRQVAAAVGIFAVIDMFVGDVSGLAAVVLGYGPELFLRRFSRDQEREADAVAVPLLVGAGIRPDGLLAFFETLRQREAEAGLNPEGVVARSLALLSTHPTTPERISALREAIKNADSTRLPELSLNYAEFKTSLERATQRAAAQATGENHADTH